MNTDELLACCGWTSVFVLTWLMVLGRVVLSWGTGAAWLFFFLVALFASVSSGTKGVGSRG